MRQPAGKIVSPTASAASGQVLLETQRQLERQVLRDHGIHLGRCERQAIQGGGVDRQLLATLEFLSASGLRPTVTAIACSGSSPASEGNAPAGAGEKADLTAVNSMAIADHLGSGSITEITIRRLLALQGSARPRRIISPARYPGAKGILVSSKEHDYIQLVFSATTPSGAHAARTLGSALDPNQWIELIARLGEIPNPTVSAKPSPQSVPDAQPSGSGPVPGEGSTGDQGQSSGDN